MAGELLLALAAAKPDYQLTQAQIEDLGLAIAEADRCEFASETELAETWKQFGL